MSLLKTVRDNAGTIAATARLGQRFLGTPTIDTIKLETAVAANVWALGHDEIGEEPFPSVGTGDLVLSDSFDVAGWGWVWFQRQFRLLHKASGVESRWINGRKKPQDIVRIN